MATLDPSRLSETFDLLTHPHRRYVLYYLTKESEVVDTTTLAAAIREWDGNVARTTQTGSDEIENALHHRHLPKLAQAGVVSFDAVGGSVELEDADGVGQYLDRTARIDDC